jgi:predicted enzyme related to lactoylglutathione lyase
VFKVGDHMAAGMIAKNDTMGPIPNYWGVYFGVDDVEASLEVVTAGGGTVLRPPFEVPGVGRMAVIGDPQGGVITIMRAERYDP